MSEPLLGEIKVVGFNFAPVGYAFANGALLSIAQSQALFALFGSVFGGDGRSTFALPNLQSRTIVGMTTAAGNNPAPLVNFELGERGGAETATLTVAQMPAHNHVAMTKVNVDTSGLTAATTLHAVTAPPSTSAVPTDNFLSVGTTGGPTPVSLKPYAPSGAATRLATGAATTSIGGLASASAATLVAGNGGSQPFALRSPFLALNYIIATQGVFPVRD
jgi:microcystin-dependent protein